MATTSSTLKMPGFVRRMSPLWGNGGSGFGPYVASLADLDRLDEARVLGIEANSDMLLGIIEGRWNVKSYVAVETDQVTAAFFVSQLADHDVRLHTREFLDDDGRSRLSRDVTDPFDLVILRSNPASLTTQNLTSLFTEIRRHTRLGGVLVLGLAMNQPTTAGSTVADHLVDQGLIDGVGDYFEYETPMGSIPLHSHANVENIGSRTGWRLDQVCEPRRSFQQHHVVMRAIGAEVDEWRTR